MLLADTVRVRSQITKGLASPQLRSGREKNSQATSGSYNRWSEEEDRELICLLWSEARGKDRVLPGRNAESCKKRLQRIHNHVDNFPPSDVPFFMLPPSTLSRVDLSLYNSTHCQSGLASVPSKIKSGKS